MTYSRNPYMPKWLDCKTFNAFIYLYEQPNGDKMYIIYSATHVKYNSTVFSNSQVCAIMTKSIFKHFRHLKNKFFILLPSLPILPSSSSNHQPWESLIYFLSLYITLFRTYKWMELHMILWLTSFTQHNFFQGTTML